MKKNVLIIGSTGFIGKNIVESLLTIECTIVLIIKESAKVPENFLNNDSIKITRANLNDIETIQKTIKSYKIDTVIHLASKLIPSSPYEDFMVELYEIIIPTYQLLELLAVEQIKIIFFSSGGTIYGQTKLDTIKETHKLNPINYYGHSKLMIEEYIQLLNKSKNLSFVILRPSNVYGKYQRIEAKQGFIAVAIGKMLNHSTLEVWGDGETIRDYIDVQDLAKMTTEIINKNVTDQIINIGSGEGTSLNQIIQYLEHILDTNMDVVYSNSRKTDVDKMILDIKKLQSMIHYKPKDIKQGIKDFLKQINSMQDTAVKEI